VFVTQHTRIEKRYGCAMV